MQVNSKEERTYYWSASASNSRNRVEMVAPRVVATRDHHNSAAAIPRHNHPLVTHFVCGNPVHEKH